MNAVLDTIARDQLTKVISELVYYPPGLILHPGSIELFEAAFLQIIDSIELSIA